MLNWLYLNKIHHQHDHLYERIYLKQDCSQTLIYDHFLFYVNNFHPNTSINIYKDIGCIIYQPIFSNIQLNWVLFCVNHINN